MLFRPAAIACLSAALGSLDSAINIGFPAITAAFSLDVTSIQWIVVSYVLTHASLLLGCGGLADLWGHGRLLICGLLVSALAFVACGLAPNFASLVAARIVQGLGAALIFGSAPALVTLSATAEERGRALGIYQMSLAAGYAVGPLIGGMLVDAFGWRAVFLFRVVPAMLLAWLAALSLPHLRERRNAKPFDLLGALSLAASVGGFLLALSRSRALGWASSEVMTLLLVSAACFAAFLVTEARASEPVVDLRLFRRPPFVIANLLTVLANCARFAIGLLMPYYIISVLRYSATIGGSLMLATSLTTALVAPISGKLSDRFGTSHLNSLGLAVQGLGLWLISRLDAQADYLSLATALGIVGLGLGLFEAPNMSFVMGSIPRTQQGVAGGIANMMRTLGIVFGATAWSMLFDQRRDFYSEKPSFQSPADFQGFVRALQDVFLSAAGVCTVAFAMSLFRRREATGSKSSIGAKE